MRIPELGVCLLFGIGALLIGCGGGSSATCGSSAGCTGEADAGGSSGATPTTGGSTASGGRNPSGGTGGSGGATGGTSGATGGTSGVDALPAGMPTHFAVGIGEVPPGDRWVIGSGVPWDFAYKYLTYDWAHQWSGPVAGSFVTDWLKTIDPTHAMPAIEYYVVRSMAPDDEGAFLVKAQTTSTMTTYFSDFKILMQRLKEYDKPVLVMVEADGFGYLETKSSDNPNTYASVAATGLTELAGLPDTVAGWGLAFLQMRKAVGANKVLLGMHISAWSSGGDLINGDNVTDDVNNYVDRGYKFFAPLGIAANQTGALYDVLITDPSDHDADWFKIVQGDSGHWWDVSDTASVNSRSFVRYAAWLSAWHSKAKRRWVLWQIPCGNSNSPDNDSGGYKDNRSEYWLGNAAHRQMFADAGVIALLFGAGNGGQTEYTNDWYSDGKLYIKSRTLTYLQSPLALR